NFPKGPSPGMPRAQKPDTGKQPAKAATKSTAPANAKKAAPATAKKAPDKGGETGDKFLDEQRALLLAERAEYTEKADELKAEADLLALDAEPGDIQFDEEGGEGGTSNVERELDLVLSAQARGAVDEIDRALAKIA